MAITLIATAAAAQRTAPSPNPRASPLYLGPTRHIPQRLEPDASDAAWARLIARWGDIGRCVAAADRSGSTAYVEAASRSPAARAAAARLGPAFARCERHHETGRSGSEAVRRAAVADALGMTAAR